MSGLGSLRILIIIIKLIPILDLVLYVTHVT